MANIKFSAFDATDPVSATIDLVAAKSGNNIRFTPADLAPFTGIYAANGTIGTTRKALITDTIQFRNAGDTSDIFIMNTDGTFALGDGATSLTNTNVVIGKNAKDNNVSSANSVIIGSNAQLYNAASQHSAIAIGESANARLYGVAIGRYSTHYGTTATTVGYSAFSGPKGVAIGYNSGVAGGTTSDVINIGYDAGSTGANSIVLNVSGSGASPTTASAFGVYMTSNTTPDFQIAHDGNSFITGTGNFGIGTSSPLYTLDTKGSVAGNWLARVENDSGTGLGLQVKVNSTDSTKRTFSTRNANGYTMSVYNDGVVEINGQAYTELHTGATPADPDWNNGNIQEMTLASSDQDFDPTNAKAGATYILKIKQPSSGAAGTINWNAASATVLWPSPGEPTLSTANNAVDIVTLICTDSASGGTYYANATLNFS